MPASPVRRVWMPLLLLLAGACGSSEPITISLAPPCTGNTPDAVFVGEWRGMLSERALTMSLRKACSGLNFQLFWVVEGTWQWERAGSGTMITAGPTWWLKGNTGAPFRGLELRLTDSTTSADTIRAVAVGELPLSQAPDGPWQTFTGDVLLLVRVSAGR